MSVIIIAEAGVNHNGELSRAKEMIEVAKASGANIVKFQTFNSGAVASIEAPMADYQRASTSKGTRQISMLKELELNVDAHRALMHHCQEVGIEFLSSAFDMDSVDLLSRLGLTTFKIPSGEITNLPYLQRVAQVATKVIMSTGMADLEEIRAALGILLESALTTSDITLLHCTTEYPTPFDEVNLKAMLTLRVRFGTDIGYSDHTTGNEVAIAAVAMGASVIEKHFTLDRALPGPDHRASLEPVELEEMISRIRNIEQALGDGVKTPMPSELLNRNAVRKSLHITRDIKAGESLLASDLVALRPGDGISPMKLHDVVGCMASRNLARSTKLNWNDLQIE